MNARNGEHYIDLTPYIAIARITRAEKRRRKHKMQQINDCVRLVQQYLRNYPLYLTAIRNLSELIEDRLQELDKSLTKTPAYGVPGAGGNPELSVTESEADRRIRLTAELKTLGQEKRELEIQVKRIDRAMRALSEDEKRAISLFHIAKRGCKAISEELYCSERKGRYLLRNAERRMAIMLFGNRAGNRIFFFN